MVIALGYAYSAAQYLEDFLFIGMALTFFSYTKAFNIVLLTSLNFISYIFILIARHNHWFPTMNQDVAANNSIFQTINLIAILITTSAVLYVINRHYKRLEAELKANAGELKLKTIVAEESLDNARKANSTKLKLIKVISHDLRGPFTGLLGLTELMESHYDSYDKEEMKHMLRMLSDSSKNTLTLIENLVNWANLQADGWKMERKNVRISSIFNQNIQIYSNMAAQKQIRFVNETDDFLLVNADENMLMVIIRNLINNAVKFTPEGGEIRIQAEAKHSFVPISIANTGTEMSQEQIDKILMKDDNTSELGTSGEKGSGLGLLLCKEFVEKHNCQMHIESNKEQGTVVTFTMPAAKIENSIS